MGILLFAGPSVEAGGQLPQTSLRLGVEDDGRLGLGTVAPKGELEDLQRDRKR